MGHSQMANKESGVSVGMDHVLPVHPLLVNCWGPLLLDLQSLNSPDAGQIGTESHGQEGKSGIIIHSGQRGRWSNWSEAVMMNRDVVGR